MNILKSVILLIILKFVSSCSQADQATNSNSDELIKFAKVNCLFWYFKKHNYDIKDIREISGGIVEMGSYSAEKYQNLSLLVKKYKPKIQTKQNIDIDLYKCFILESDKEFINTIDNLK